MLYSTISSASLRCHDFVSVSYLQAHHIKKKKKDQTTISVYCTLGVCISNRAAPCLCPALFRLLDTGLMLIIGLLDAVLEAHMCSMGWISIMNPGLFLLKNECGILVVFKQGLVSESSVWTAELGCFLSSQKHQVIL